MTRNIIRHLGLKYAETKQTELLAQAVECADFSDDWGPNAEIQKEAAAFIRKHTRNHKFQTSVRDNTIRLLHKLNKSQGMSSEESYRAIKEKFDEWTELAAEERKQTGEDFDNIHVTVETEAIRKIITEGNRKPKK